VPAILLVNIRYPNVPIWTRLERWITPPGWLRVPKWVRLPKWIWLRNLVLYFNLNALLPESESFDAPQRRVMMCPPSRLRSSPYEPSHRTIFTNVDVRVYAWPSNGGVIILDHAEAVDLEFLGLDTLNPPNKRLPNQPDEDAFCQRLLLLGAKWWESEDRFRLLVKAMGNEPGTYRAIQALKEEAEPNPSIKERRWVSVAWPTTGGLWVTEFDTDVCGFVDEEDNLVPDDIIRLKLARTMDERSEILRNNFKAKYYADIGDYNGHTFLNSWEERRLKKLDH